MKRVIKSVLLSGFIVCHIASTQAGITDYALAGISASCACANYMIAKEIKWSQEAIEISRESIKASQDLQFANKIPRDNIEAYFVSQSFIQKQKDCIAHHQQKVIALEKAQSAVFVAAAISGIPLLP